MDKLRDSLRGRLLRPGDVTEGEQIAQPLADHLKVFDAGVPPGQRWYSRSHYLKDLNDDVTKVFLKHSANMQGTFTFAYFEWLRPGEEGDATVMEWVRGFHEDMAQFSSGGV